MQERQAGAETFRRAASPRPDRGKEQKCKNHSWAASHYVTEMGGQRVGDVSDLVVDVEVKGGQGGPGGRITVRLQSFEESVRDVKLICICWTGRNLMF